MYVNQVLKDQEAISCKMSNIQSKNFRMYTQYIFKRALVNYENKRYWLDSIYSLPFGHPWIEKIEKDKLKISEVIDIITSEEYTYELSVFNKKREEKEKEEEIKREAIRRDEEAKKKIISNEEVVVTNLNERELEIISEGDGLKTGVNKLLSMPGGLKLLGGMLKGKLSKNEI